MLAVRVVLAVLWWSAGVCPVRASATARLSQCQLACRDGFQLVPVTAESVSRPCSVGCQSYNDSTDQPAAQCIKNCFEKFEREEARLACQLGCSEAKHLIFKALSLTERRVLRRQKGHEATVRRRWQKLTPQREQWPQEHSPFDLAVELDSGVSLDPSPSQLYDLDPAEQERDQPTQWPAEEDRRLSAGRREPPRRRPDGGAARGIDFLECVSRRTGLSRWLVGLVLTAALLVTVWLTASFLLALVPAGDPKADSAAAALRSEVTGVKWVDLTAPDDLMQSKVPLLSPESEQKTPMTSEKVVTQTTPPVNA